MIAQTFRMLSSSGTDRVTWMRAWTLTGREPFAHPGYLELFSPPGDEAVCALLETPEGVWMLPLLLRRLDSESWARDSEYRDATSPYGYGGPYGDGANPPDELWDLLMAWMAQHQVVSMFGRLALEVPVPGRLPKGAGVDGGTSNVVVDLTRPSDEQWRHYEHKVRKNVNKAQRAGLRAEVLSSFTDLEEFWRLYEATMDRRGALPWYHFGLDFFASLTDTLAGSYRAAEVRDSDGRLVSAELVLCSDSHLYSFLGGTLTEAFPQAPNDLLKHSVIEDGRAAGRTGYVLGGGYAEDDGIYRYKKAFDPTGQVPFHRLTLVVDQAAYDALTVMRLSHERSTDPLVSLDDRFFPAYRGYARKPKE